MKDRVPDIPGSKRVAVQVPCLVPHRPLLFPTSPRNWVNSKTRFYITWNVSKLQIRRDVNLSLRFMKYDVMKAYGGSSGIVPHI
jgi:hypothetical protein